MQEFAETRTMSGGEDWILSVFELTRELRHVLEQMTVGLWVEGEVGSISRPQSGHIYFSLKDEEQDAMISAVMYRREALRFGRHLSEGSRVQVRGRASLYAARGNLQWIADAVRPAGQGALLEALAKLRAKLIGEGLTDQSRKRPLPGDPRSIGVVTSRDGAAFFDIVKVALRRSAVNVILSPALVQGDDAPASIIAALDLIERVQHVDALIVGRGGGSQEDLMAFNDERVVRRIAACRVPVVSAVGHEVDISLADLVADVRAATPSQAAELLVPDVRARHERLRRLLIQLSHATGARVSREQARLGRVLRRMGDPRAVLLQHEQRQEELRRRMIRALQRTLARERQAATTWWRRLDARHPKVVLTTARTQLLPLEQRLLQGGQLTIARRKSDLRETARALGALSPLAILGRGYALVSDSSGGLVRSAADVSPGESLSVRVHRGRFGVTVEPETARVELQPAFEDEFTGGEPNP
jgi:exodeoxyribonuclease VII large subunit